MDKREINRLLNKYTAGNCSEEEKALVETWYNRQQTGDIPRLPDAIVEEDLEKIYRALPREQKTRPVSWLRIAAALALIICATGLYFYLDNSAAPAQLTSNTPQAADKDIAPGSNKAVLILDDGTAISLDDTESGKIAEQNGIKITKTENGLLTYTATGSSAAGQASPAFNTISTPRGGQYQIVLPDETKVWLNAASSLTYPTAFTGKERKVTLSGEGYFEVEPNKERPFRVVTKGQVVEVLGTHFNINSYLDEPFVKTTLVEGSVKVVEGKSSSSMILEPGEQSKLSENAFSVSRVNIGNEIAWKNGLFQFQGSDIQSVMRQLSRWYDVDVEFKGAVPDIQLWGEVYRNVNASQALEILEYFNLKYKITEVDSRKKITIY